MANRKIVVSSRLKITAIYSTQNNVGLGITHSEYKYLNQYTMTYKDKVLILCDQESKE